MLPLPSWPDANTLQTMSYWAAGGGACGVAAVTFNWIVKPGIFGEVVREAPLHVPGAPKPEDPVPPPWSAAGLRAALIGALAGALFGWAWYSPEEVQRPLGVVCALVGVAQSVWQLVRVHRDVPAVGEPPPDDPDETVGARLPGAWWGIGAACLGVAMAWF